MKKRLLALLLAAVAVFVLAGCGGSETPSPTASDGGGTAGMKPEDIKVGFVYIGPVGDGGWTDAHDNARKVIEQEFGITTLIKENVPENAQCEEAIRDLISQGCNVIFTTSFGYMDFTLNVAAQNPDVKFFHATGYKRAENVSTYNGRMYQSRYLAGIVAGMKSETGKLGYVGAYSIPEVVRGINAFALGAQSVNPDATVEVVWTQSWVDPAAAKNAAIELLNRGCDVIGNHQDFTTPQTAAQERGKFATGNNVSTPDAAPQAYLTAPLFNWVTFYRQAIQSIVDGSYAGNSDYWGSYKDGMVGLDTLSAICAEGTQEKVDEAVAKLNSGTWDVFTGEILDQDGNVKVAAGASMTDEELLGFNWFVKGVIGTIE